MSAKQDLDVLCDDLYDHTIDLLSDYTKIEANEKSKILNLVNNHRDGVADIIEKVECENDSFDSQKEEEIDDLQDEINDLTEDNELMLSLIIKYKAYLEDIVLFKRRDFSKQNLIDMENDLNCIKDEIKKLTQ
jgi:hypothetical protein